MKRSLGGPGSPARSPLQVTLRLRRLAVAAVGGAAVVVTAGSQMGSDPVEVAPASAAQATPEELSSAGSATTLPTELPQAAALSAARPDLERAARTVARGGDARTVAAIGAPDEADLTDIPAPALAAYQRAAAVIDEAMPSCGLEWELVAAIGRVESDHGRYGGARLDRDGVATPAILGVALTGRDGTSRVADSDAGQLDGDRRLDRAVGPMQFLPSTWSVVGVDADGDGERDPQDIDDAALAAAVYLCGDEEDLTTSSGLRDAVFSYNRSNDYVDTVLALMKAYAKGQPASTVTPVSSVQLGSTGSTGSTPTGAAPLTGAVQQASDQQRADEAKAAGAEGKDGQQGDRGRDGKGGNGGKGGKVEVAGHTVRHGSGGGHGLVSDGVNVPGGPKGGDGEDSEEPTNPGTEPDPDPGDPTDPEAPVTPGEGDQGDQGEGDQPGEGDQGGGDQGDAPAEPDPAQPSQPAPGETAPAEPAPAEPVGPTCPADLVLELSDGRVLTTDDLLLDQTLLEDELVAGALLDLGYDPLTCLG